MCLGRLAGASAGELDDFSVDIFLWRLKRLNGQREGGKMDTVLSIGGLYEDPRVFGGPILPH